MRDVADSFPRNKIVYQRQPAFKFEHFGPILFGRSKVNGLISSRDFKHSVRTNGLLSSYLNLSSAFNKQRYWYEKCLLTMLVSTIHF